jgi:hypothetical protein
MVNVRDFQYGKLCDVTPQVYCFKEVHVHVYGSPCCLSTTCTTDPEYTYDFFFDLADNV